MSRHREWKARKREGEMAAFTLATQTMQKPDELVSTVTWSNDKCAVMLPLTPFTCLTFLSGMAHVAIHIRFLSDLCSLESITI